jgi:hypothetical protein
MPCLLAVIALMFPRLLMAVLWFFTDWFSGVFSSTLWPVLGFIFLPVTTLWYSVVFNKYGGEWSTFNIVLLVIAIMIDMGSWNSGYRNRNRR